jgi:hypothetical protein
MEAVINQVKGKSAVIYFPNIVVFEYDAISLGQKNFDILVGGAGA